MPKETVLSVVKQIRNTLDVRLPMPNLKIVAVGGPSKETDFLRFRNTPDRFEKLSDGWVKDKLLGIDWGPTYSEKMTWQKAESKCKKDGYRQATPEEMSTLIDRSKYNPAIVAGVEILNIKTDDWYWTSTPCAWYSGSAWCVYFSYGVVSSGSKGSNYYVRPVRSSQ